MASRRIRFLRTTVRWTALPTRVSRVTARAVARQVVSVSGKLNRTCARPAESVVSVAAQKAVSGKALRTPRLDEVLGLELRQVRAAGKPRQRPKDRKSTRLNSSHRCISYAVFCLKKK